jgi:enamine deaminase RidA (YjgF/YER057c/UK114 family)
VYAGPDRRRRPQPVTRIQPRSWIVNIIRHEQGPILSQAVEHGQTVYLAGIVARDLSQDIKGQTRQVLGEIDRLLAKCGSGRSRILQCHIWVTDIRNRAPMNEVWNEWVDKANLPCRACVEARLADPDALVEIMVIAAK